MAQQTVGIIWLRACALLSFNPFSARPFGPHGRTRCPLPGTPPVPGNDGQPGEGLWAGPGLPCPHRGAKVGNRAAHPLPGGGGVKRGGASRHRRARSLTRRHGPICPLSGFPCRLSPRWDPPLRDHDPLLEHAVARRMTFIWGALVVGALLLWIARPELFTGESVAGSIARMGAWSFAGYVVVSLFRGVLLMPSTPVVFAGGILFPGFLWLVLLVSMVGIVFSATLLYRFPGYGGYDQWLEARHPERLANFRVHLTKPRAQWFVALWAFTPVVPTDLICYAAGLVRMPFQRMILGIVIGELPLVTAYLIMGSRLGAALAS